MLVQTWNLWKDTQGIDNWDFWGGWSERATYFPFLKNALTICIHLSKMPYEIYEGASENSCRIFIPFLHKPLEVPSRAFGHMLLL